MGGRPHGLTLHGMKSPLACLLVLCVAEVSAQSWCAQGARWHHNYVNLSIGDVGYSVTEYMGDVLFEDSVCQRLTVTNHIYSYQTQNSFLEGPFDWYTTTGPEIVYVWTGMNFDTLYNFAAVPGDGWYVPGAWEDENAIIEVSDTGHMVIAGVDRRWLAAVTYVDGSPRQDTIVEGIGPMMAYLQLAWSHLVDNGYTGPRCYEDAVNSYQRVPDACSILLGTEERTAPNRMLFGPNPATDQVQVFWGPDHAPSSAVLIDMSGRAIHRWPISGSAAKTNWLPLDGMAEGQYILQLTFKDGVQRTPLSIAR